MRRLLIATVREILDSPFKGDSHAFLSKVLATFQGAPTNLEILDLMALFLADCEKKKSIGINFFSKEFAYLESLDLFHLFYTFLHRMGARLAENGPLLDTFFAVLGSLVLKQKKSDRLNHACFLQMWKFVCGNDFRLLKDKFSSFVVAHYTRFVHRFSVFPQLFSKSAIEELLKLKQYYRGLPGGTPSEESLRASFRSGRRVTPAEPTGEVSLGPQEQLLFKLLFLIENSVGSKPNLKLLSATLSDELFVVLEPLKDFKGYVELWYIVNFLPRTAILQQFLLKLSRFQEPGYAVFFLESSNLSLSRLDERKLSGRKKALAKKYRAGERRSRAREAGAEKKPQELFETRRFALCKQIIQNLRSAFEYDNQAIVGNMLDLLLRFFFAGPGFLGQADCDGRGDCALDEDM